MNIFKVNKELKNFYILQSGQFISQFGSRMTSFALIMWAYEKSGSVVSSSVLTICNLLPSILLSFFAGSLIDNCDKKKVMLITNMVAALFSIATLALIFTDQLKFSYLYIINFILGVVNAFEDPALNVLISMIVSKEFYTKTSGFRSFTNAFITTFAPVVCTFFYTLFGLITIVSFDLFTFIAAFISLMFFVKVPQGIVNGKVHEGNFISNCRMGIDYILKKKGIFHLIIFMGFVNFIAAIYNCNFTPMILSRTMNNKFQLGVVSSMIGIAGIVGSILVSIVKEPKKRIPFIIKIMTFSFLIYNGMLGIGRNYYIWTIAVFLGNCLVPFLMANVEYLMRTKIPLEMQGRVFSARNTLQYFSIPLGYIIGGLLSDKVLEPFMKSSFGSHSFFSILVGTGKGAGIGLIYIIIAIAGFLGCCLFMMDKDLKSLDN